MGVEVRIPSLGESVSQGVIARWLKENGDLVAVDDALLELETDKATLEIPAEAAGRLEILKPAGETVEVGTVVARIADGAAASRPVPPAAPTDAAPGVERADTVELAPLSPAVRKLVAENALDPAKIAGTGKGGRLTKEDVLRVIEGGRQEEAAAKVEPGPEAPGAAPASIPEAAAPAARPAPDVERVAMTRLRKRIAERLVEAQRTAAILTTFNEIDMSAVMALRKRYKERFEKAYGVGLGFMSLFARACVLGLRDLPVINASIEGDDVVYHRRVHLGIAVGTPRGLVVPVVRGADALSIAGLEKAIGELAALARDGKLLPDHLAGGTFTISNGGVYGSLLSTPILTPPQSAILGMHKIEERPVAIDGQVVIRPMMYVALSYDHRLIDGEQAVTFLVRVKERLEDPARMVLEV
ncbi:MAG: 2-oxoglutarate dehydrogenase complex dihydrolipoyllysine-residue succinyltransferase [Deltaproteobacteria bacterium]|nr:2-oxoglutarate dehydrogenase complex dihydrolipoyllysine-residue succinyltransferase [Deltaproteobacteria bacterium]